jgi:hypothetical protein
MKQVHIGNTAFSKVICGSNPFYGHSHFSEARDAEYRHRFDDQRIEHTIRCYLDRGGNTVESAANERMVSILTRLRDRPSRSVHFVGTTRIDETSDITSHRQKVAFLIAQRANICLVHSQFVDRPRKGDSIGGLKELVDQIHEAGLLAGISTHRVATIELCEKQSIGIDTYMFPLNLLGFAYPGYQGTESVQERVAIVRGVPRPFILIKALAAGRIPPKEGLQFLADNAKPNDLISIGFGSEQEAEESMELVEKMF